MKLTKLFWISGNLVASLLIAQGPITEGLYEEVTYLLLRIDAIVDLRCCI